MAVLVPDEVLAASGLSETELRLELAVLLFEKDRLTLGQASHLAGIAQADFMQVLAARGLPLHYGVVDFEQDLRTLTELRRR